MKNKLTLTIDKEVVLNAKEYAKTEGYSLFDLVENYLKLLTSEKRVLK